jgi:hypothetical protein
MQGNLPMARSAAPGAESPSHPLAQLVLGVDAAELFRDDLKPFLLNQEEQAVLLHLSPCQHVHLAFLCHNPLYFYGDGLNINAMLHYQTSVNQIKLAEILGIAETTLYLYRQKAYRGEADPLPFSESVTNGLRLVCYDLGQVRDWLARNRPKYLPAFDAKTMYFEEGGKIVLRIDDDPNDPRPAPSLCDGDLRQLLERMASQVDRIEKLLDGGLTLSPRA